MISPASTGQSAAADPRVPALRVADLDDEVPMKAGRKGRGQMKQTYFWPVYGERDEVVFTWSESRSRTHAAQHYSTSGARC